GMTLGTLQGLEKLDQIASLRRGQCLAAEHFRRVVLAQQFVQRLRPAVVKVGYPVEQPQERRRVPQREWAAVRFELDVVVSLRRVVLALVADGAMGLALKELFAAAGGLTTGAVLAEMRVGWRLQCLEVGEHGPHLVGCWPGAEEGLGVRFLNRRTQVLL